MDNNNNTRRSRRVSCKPSQPPFECKSSCSQFSSVRHCELDPQTVTPPRRIVNATQCGGMESATALIAASLLLAIDSSPLNRIGQDWRKPRSTYGNKPEGKMKISKNDFKSAAYEILPDEEQLEAIWRAMELRTASVSQFNLAHVIYYFGALIVISAMGWYMTLGWESFGGSGIAAISLAYAIGFFFVGRALWNKWRLAVPGGLLLALAAWVDSFVFYWIRRA